MFKVTKNDDNSRARVGVLETPHGFIETPSYVIVGTHGTVRCLEPGDLPLTKTQLVIANTYHMWRMLGDDGLEDFPGLHQFMQWQGPIMTDSGGFQVFSLGFLREQGMRQFPNAAADPARNLVRITPSGVHFRPDDGLGQEGLGEEVYLDAELSIKLQEYLGADIIVAFDEPNSPAHDYEYVKQSLQRTHEWAVRSLEAKSSDQLLYGVVQGSSFEDLRSASARFIGALPFDGFAIGGTYGEAYGGTRNQTAQALEWSIPLLPAGKPRHLFGVGRIEDLFLGVEAGIDTFDCVIPTREARHGRLWTHEGPVDITKALHADDERPLGGACGCPSCRLEGVTRAKLHAAFKSKDSQAGRWATMHNIYFFNDLMGRIRDAIVNGTLPQLKKQYLKTA